MKNPILKYVFCAVVMFAAIFSLSAHSFADTLTVGSPMPFFRISSGANEILTLDNIKGKVTVLFYESKSAVEDNRKLKTALNEFYAGEPDNLKKDILKVAVVNCRGVVFTGIWKSALRDTSVKEGLTIYGDWDGKMAADLGVAQGTSNVFIIDTKGIVRYFGSGKLGDKDISAIEALLASFKNAT